MKLLTPTTLIDAPHIFDGAKLEVDALWQASDTLALLCHPNPKIGGAMTNKVITTMFRFCRTEQMNVVRFNYRGVGRSDGQIDYGHGEYLDTLCVLKWALNQTAIRRLWLGGFSFGGFIACQVADKLQTIDLGIELEKLVLIAPSVEKHNPAGLVLDTIRTTMIYGNCDELVSPSSMIAFAKDFGLDSIVICGANHSFDGRLADVTQALINSCRLAG